jgi:hypothetical protein
MHIIRLRGPWQLEPVERFIHRGAGRYDCSREGLPAGARATMPADWSRSFGREFLGRVRYRRTFQKPTGLESGERVWLVVEPPRTHGTVRLGDTLLGDLRWGGPTGRYDITDRLEDHNRLEIIVAHPALDDGGAAEDETNMSLPGGIVGEVRMEIEE